MRASFGASTSATATVPLSVRFRLRVLLLRMCCLNALLRRNFPLFVRLKRLAAPRWVFSFGIVSESLPRDLSVVGLSRGCGRRLRLAAAGLRPAAENRVHL